MVDHRLPVNVCLNKDALHNVETYAHTSAFLSGVHSRNLLQLGDVRGNTPT